MNAEASANASSEERRPGDGEARGEIVSIQIVKAVVVRLRSQHIGDWRNRSNGSRRPGVRCCGLAGGHLFNLKQTGRFSMKRTMLVLSLALLSGLASLFMTGTVAQT
jgi:hypothetical protein